MAFAHSAAPCSTARPVACSPPPLRRPQSASFANHHNVRTSWGGLLGKAIKIRGFPQFGSSSSERMWTSAMWRTVHPSISWHRISHHMERSEMNLTSRRLPCCATKPPPRDLRSGLFLTRTCNTQKLNAQLKNYKNFKLCRNALGILGSYLQNKRGAGVDEENESA